MKSNVLAAKRWVISTVTVRIEGEWSSELRIEGTTRDPHLFLLGGRTNQYPHPGIHHVGLKTNAKCDLQGCLEDSMVRISVTKTNGINPEMGYPTES